MGSTRTERDLPSYFMRLVRTSNSWRPAIKKTAARLGIEKIDAADAGGYLVFGEDTRIDPLGLIQLVQSDSRRFRLQGSHRLQIRDDMTNLDKRFATIENLMEQLTVKT